MGAQARLDEIAMPPEAGCVLGGLITLLALLLRWQGTSWARVIGQVAVLVGASGLAVLLVVAGLHVLR